MAVTLSCIDYIGQINEYQITALTRVVGIYTHWNGDDEPKTTMNISNSLVDLNLIWAGKG